jgi:uncharacterized protein with beta-barrel porin domain
LRERFGKRDGEEIGGEWRYALRRLLLALAALGAMTASSFAQNLVSDPGFETTSNPQSGVFCTAAGWTATGPCTSAWDYGTGVSHSGAIALVLASPASGTANISQSINLQAGKYDFSFWYSQSFPGVGTFVASIGGKTSTFDTNGSHPYVQFDQLVALASGPATVAFTNTGSGNLGDVNIDDVSLIYLGPFTLTPLLPSGAPVNAINVAAAIDNAAINSNSTPQLFQSLNLYGLSGTQLVAALTQLDGETSTDAERGAFQLMNQFLGLMLDPFVDGRFGPGGAIGFAPDREAAFPPDIALAYASVMKAPVYKAPTNPWNVWGTGFGGGSHSNGDPLIGSTDVGTRTYGFASGVDYRVTANTVVGFALAGAGTNWGLAQQLGAGRSDAFQAGGYGKTELGPIYLAGAFAFTNNWFTTNRLALGDQLTANFNGQSYGGRLEGGYRFIVPSAPNFEILPYAAVQAQSFHTPSYSETDLNGLGLGLNYNAMNATDTRSELGARFTDRTMVNAMPLILRVRLAWAHDWVDNPALNAVFQALPGSSFVVNGAPIPADSALVSAGAELLVTPHWSLSGKFDGEFAKSSQTYAGRGTLRYSW